MCTTRKVLILTLACIAPLAIAPGALAQDLTFEFQVTIGGVSSDWHAFGLREDAQQGIDGYDLPEPPAAPGTTFRSYLSMFEPLEGLPNRWLYDFRPVNSITLDRVELWQLFIESPALGAVCRIDVRAREPIGVPYDLYFFGPGTYYQSLQAPASISFPIDAPLMVQFFELRLDESVGAESATWGGVKSLYR
jgi:hypothetical protein